MVLLPTSSNKLLAEWQGPYEVVRRVGRVVYKVDMKDRRRRKRIFHVNMLRECIAPTASFFTAEEGIKEDDGDVIYERTRDEPPIINSLLSPQQTKELQTLLLE